MRLSLLLFLMSIEIVLVVSRRCHTCETKTIDRFSGEESVTDKCSSYPSTLKYMNCTDPREYCSFYVFNHINYKDYTRGCAIPRGRYTKKRLLQMNNTPSRSLWLFRRGRCSQDWDQIYLLVQPELQIPI